MCYVINMDKQLIALSRLVTGSKWVKGDRLRYVSPFHDSENRDVVFFRDAKDSDFDFKGYSEDQVKPNQFCIVKKDGKESLINRDNLKNC
jgi:hypothetical protein